MKIYKKKPARVFKVGKKIYIKHMANIYLENNELITFKSSGTEYDFSKKNWGYYSTPSINSRLNYYGFDVFLVKNKIDGKYFIFSVIKKKKKYFIKYLRSENLKIICILNSKNLKRIDELFL